MDYQAHLQAELIELHPGRSKVIETLMNALHDPAIPVGPSYHLRVSSPGRAYSLVRSIVHDSLSRKICVLDPLFHASTPFLLAALKAAFLPDYTGPAGLDATLSALRDVVGMEEEDRFFVLVKNAERMRDCWEENVQEVVWGLAEALNGFGKVSVIAISKLPVTNFRTSRGAGAILGSGAPIILSLPALRRDDALKLLAQDCTSLLPSAQQAASSSSSRQASSSSSAPSEAQWRNLHAAYIGIAYDTMASDITDEEMLRAVVASVWWVFIVPVQHGEMKTTEVSRLLSRAAPLMREALLLLPTALNARTWLTHALRRATYLTLSTLSRADVSLRAPPSLETQGAPSLPLLARYLLLASFLASFNPARLDARYFLRDENVLLPDASTTDTSTKRKRGGALQKRPRKRRAGGGGGREEMNRQRLLGPLAFSADRLAAILQSLLLEAQPGLQGRAREDVGWETRRSDAWETRVRGTAMGAVINNLIALRLLTRLGAPNTLLTGTASNLRCNITYETAFAVAKTLDFDLAEWLYDFEEGL